jgi:hypothetical protein
VFCSAPSSAIRSVPFHVSSPSTCARRWVPPDERELFPILSLFSQIDANAWLLSYSIITTHQAFLQEWVLTLPAQRVRDLERCVRIPPRAPLHPSAAPIHGAIRALLSPNSLLQRMSLSEALGPGGRRHVRRRRGESS